MAQVDPLSLLKVPMRPQGPGVYYPPFAVHTETKYSPYNRQRCEVPHENTHKDVDVPLALRQKHGLALACLK